MNIKRCTKCQTDKPEEDFPKRSGRNTSHAWCRECYQEYKQDYYRENREAIAQKRKARYKLKGNEYRQQMRDYYNKSDKSIWRDKCWASKLLREYGMTEEEYQGMFDKQAGRCAICEQPERHTHNGRVVRLAVDHCHETGLVRGLLCRNCNVAIGLLSHCSERLQKAVDYLTKPKLDKDLDRRVEVDHVDVLRSIEAG